MINGSGHDKTVDWWALGILIYEMLIGVTPFFNKNRQVLMSKIKHAKIVFPDRAHFKIDYSDDLVDLVTLLLKKDRTQRLGFKNDAQEILSHKWFADLDMNKLLAYQLPPPFKPDVSEKNIENSQYFNIVKDKRELAETVVPKENLQAVKKNSDLFAQFDQKQKK